MLQTHSQTKRQGRKNICWAVKVPDKEIGVRYMGVAEINTEEKNADKGDIHRNAAVPLKFFLPLKNTVQKVLTELCLAKLFFLFHGGNKLPYLNEPMHWVNLVNAGLQLSLCKL